MIKAVIFDVDGVLIDSFEVNLRFIQRLMIKAGYGPPTREEYKSVFAMTLMDAIRTLIEPASEEEVKRIWKIGRGREVKYEADLLVMPKGAGKVIENMNKDYALGIVTSRVKECVYEAPELAELAKHFQVTVSYQDTANHKPHPEPLLLAASKLGVGPEECVYIGDVSSDLKAGQAAGMKVIIYSKNKPTQADAWTTSFTELPSLVSSLVKAEAVSDL